MYASIRRYEGIDKETATELARRGHLFRERLSQLPGFVAYEVILGDDSIASITVFETWVTAAESNVLAARWVKDNAAELALTKAQVTAGEIYEEPGASRGPFVAPPPIKLRDHEPRL